MILLYITIPVMLLAVAIATVPLLAAMRIEANRARPRPVPRLARDLDANREGDMAA